MNEFLQSVDIVSLASTFFSDAYYVMSIVAPMLVAGWAIYNRRLYKHAKSKVSLLEVQNKNLMDATSDKSAQLSKSQATATTTNSNYEYICAQNRELKSANNQLQSQYSNECTAKQQAELARKQKEAEYNNLSQQINTYRQTMVEKDFQIADAKNLAARIGQTVQEKITEISRLQCEFTRLSEARDKEVATLRGEHQKVLAAQDLRYSTDIKNMVESHKLSDAALRSDWSKDAIAREKTSQDLRNDVAALKTELSRERDRCLSKDTDLNTARQNAAIYAERANTTTGQLNHANTKVTTLEKQLESLRAAEQVRVSDIYSLTKENARLTNDLVNANSQLHAGLSIKKELDDLKAAMKIVAADLNETIAARDDSARLASDRYNTISRLSDTINAQAQKLNEQDLRWKAYKAAVSLQDAEAKLRNTGANPEIMMKLTDAQANFRDAAKAWKPDAKDLSVVKAELLG